MSQPTSERPAQRWRATLRGELMAARKERDAVRVSALRSALSAIDNAETPDGPAPRAGAITDSAMGLGAAEVARRTLTDAEIRTVIRAEVDERIEAAEQLASAGRPDRAADVHAEIAVLTGLLEDV
ncbi:MULTISPECIES: GatB/YqeY domain-containing protein [unclassified Mycobacterium]|uniref:GatB/YqeY domain-containing protein n=1 Tax=unclassified Mycobacterium TaxID=2642494 RepID=UPI0029C82EB2|nr:MULTISPECIES: GatB/YqeY domain-containing protein [unclassified Mycobacterium]